jgi:hypothetical protein
MWGIQRRDRRWFQLFTLLGGIVGSVGLTWLELLYGPQGGAPNSVIRNIVLGIGASFIAAGFISWGLLHIKEMFMAIADWIREATERRRQRIRAEAIAEGKAEGIAQGYRRGYEDAIHGKPPEVPLEQTDQPPSPDPKSPE